MDSEIDQYPTHITEAVNNAVLNLLPEKSRKVYDGFYQKFKEWHVKNGLKEIREEVLLAYFFEESKRLKPSSLWSQYSMLRSTLCIYDDVDISKFPKLRAFLKRQSVGFRPKKSKVLSRDDIHNFLKNGPDERYLMIKVS